MLQIRDAASADAEEIAGMAQALAREVASGPAVMTASAVQADLLAWPGLVLLIAERGGAPAGYTLAHISYETAYAARGFYVADLYVAPQHRQARVARALLAELARRAEAQGATYLWLVASPGNAAAQAAYDRLGFTRDVSNARAVFGPSFDALLKG
ncbi:MAG: GNAT family N-acetyltransferase [Pikeienuella sp.]